MALSGALGLGLVARDARDAAAFCVAGVAQSHIHLRFAWQAWHSWHSVARLDLIWSPVTSVTPRHFAFQAWHNLTSSFVLRGRRGTISHPPSFRVAGVALSGALGVGLVARDAREAAAFCVAGVAQSHIHLRLTSQTWHNLTSTFVSRGRRGTHGTQLHTHLRFTRQAWHNLTSTFVSRGRRGTISHPPSFHVAGVAQSHIHLRFTWQAWHNLTSTFVSRGRRGTHGTQWRAWTWFGRP